MQKKIEDAFNSAKINSCIENIKEKKFEIYDCDHEKRCYIASENGQFRVLNAFKKSIVFVAIDKCIFFDDDSFKKCDCALYDDNSLCFIEIKSCKVANRRKNKKKAIEQLKSTIKIFKDNLEIDRALEAYLCVGLNPNSPPRASSSDKKLEFEEELDTKLFEGCSKEFLL